MLKDVVNSSNPLPNGSKLLIFGRGFSGNHVALAAKALGNKVFCSKRRIHKAETDFVFNSETEEIPSEKILENTTHLLSCIPPNKNGEDPVLSRLAEQIKKMPLEWVGYLSTTGVYGDRKGNWVDEYDLPNPQQMRSRRRLACEKAWLDTNLPIQILRLPGIYGPGRSAIESLKRGRAKMIDKPKQVFSRVHIDDIAGAIFHLITLNHKGIQPKIINIADDLPSSNLEVLKYAASILDYDLPSVEPFEIAKNHMNPMALSFWEENRKVRNNLLCKKLGYSLIHTNYKSGLNDCLNDS